MGLEAAATALAGASVHSALEARQARKAEGRAREADQRIQLVKEARERRRVIREARIQRAEIEANAQASGTAATSSAISGAAGVSTQAASNLSFLDTVSQLQSASNMFRADAARDRGKAADAAAVGQVAGTAASIFARGGS